MMTELRFDGKVAIVTGGARGVGRCHALSLASRGAKVVVADVGGAVDGTTGFSAEPAAQVVAEIRAAGGDAVACHASVADETEAASIVQVALDTWGRLDILVNNAGIGAPALFEDQTSEQFRRLLDVHYLGLVYVTKATWPHMVKAGGGRIVNTCSEVPLGIHGWMTAYGGAKGGAIGFTLTLAAESQKHGIFVNGFSPRSVTRLAEQYMVTQLGDQRPKNYEAIVASMKPEFASPALVYLAHESCLLNGVILCCGGGQALRIAFAENDGFHSDAMSPELIAEHIDEIVDMSATHLVGVGSNQGRQAEARVG
jgi:NAD(P)-dependent dehydrogenase (short-subunit alcohol dehydrogenase family)